MNKREPLMDSAYFERLVEFRTSSAPKFEERIRRPDTSPEHRSSLVYALFRQSYEVLITRYSAGAPVSELRKSFPAVVAAWERYLGTEGHEDTVFEESLDDYIRSLWLVSLAILLDVEAGIFARLLKCIGNEGRDRLFERLVATRVPNRPKAERLLWPKPYQLLDDAIVAAPEKRSALFQKFLKTWYPSLKDAYWHDNHKGPEGGGFFGYWCFEAAAAVKAFGFQDESFRDTPYYPKDLVHPAG